MYCERTNGTKPMLVWYKKGHPSCRTLQCLWKQMNLRRWRVKMLSWDADDLNATVVPTFSSVKWPKGTFVFTFYKQQQQQPNSEMWGGLMISTDENQEFKLPLFGSINHIFGLHQSWAWGCGVCAYATGRNRCLRMIYNLAGKHLPAMLYIFTHKY